MDHAESRQPRLVTVEEYERMLQLGIFAKAERLELIEGQIFRLAPPSALLTSLVQRLDRRLGEGTTTRVLVSVHDPIRLARSEVQPDLALLKPRDDNYFSGHPSAGEVLLVIEAAETSTDFERSTKIPLYGRSGIAEAWLIDLAEQAIEVYRGPGPSGYRRKKTCARGDHLTALALPAIELSAAEILGAGT